MAEKWKRIEKEGYSLIVQDGGPTLGIGQADILYQDGFAFKDLNRNGILDPYEDWRLPLEERIADLVSRLSIDMIAGLMLHSLHQTVCKGDPMADMLYPNRPKQDTRQHIWDITEGQKNLLTENNIRHLLLAMVEDAPTAARWNNHVQAFTEGLELGIPVNISSDPRHIPVGTGEFDMGAGGDLSVWPDHIGLAATFDPELVKRFGEIAAKEYRAMGITTALSPQIDLATDPRWFRLGGTFGEGVKLTIAMARAYCDGFQTSLGEREIGGGWGYDSVNAMVKHWPGGGSGESGRDAHYGYGKYAVFPGRNLEEHLRPFLEGAFNLDGKTGKAAAVMPYYTASWGLDTKYGENVANSYSKFIITDLLREKYGYDGLVCTDWMITSDPGPIDYTFGGKCWGVENLSVAGRHYKIIMAGVDQFGGNNDIAPVLEAYQLGVKEHGEAAMKERFTASARRILRNSFRTGLFENPYVDPEESRKIAGNAEFVKAGYEAQVKSIVMLKNRNNALPLKPGIKVYIPKRHLPASRNNFFGMLTPEQDVVPVNLDIAGKYFTITDDPAGADAALCFIESPKGLGYEAGRGYLPISLQYRPWTAINAREKNIAGTDDRAYRGKTGTTTNEPDLDMLLDTRKKMGSKPVIVLINTRNPFVPAEFEGEADGILLDFMVQPQALLDILSGKAEPSGLLPFQMPANMETVETQLEDVPFDMKCYTAEDGAIWDFAFGLNWHGLINDERVKKFGR
jgi:beta-glucosidase